MVDQRAVAREIGYRNRSAAVGIRRIYLLLRGITGARGSRSMVTVRTGLPMGVVPVDALVVVTVLSSSKPEPL